jgi:hypothetical protein
MEADALEDVVDYAQEHVLLVESANVELRDHNFYIKGGVLLSQLTLAALKMLRMSCCTSFSLSSFLMVALVDTFPK